MVVELCEEKKAITVFSELQSQTFYSAGETSAGVNSYTTSKMMVNQPTRVILRCQGTSEDPKLVRLPKTIQELLDMGSMKFGCYCTKVVSAQGAEIDEIEPIRDGDQLSLVCDGKNNVSQS